MPPLPDWSQCCRPNTLHLDDLGLGLSWLDKSGEGLAVGAHTALGSGGRCQVLSKAFPVWQLGPPAPTSICEDSLPVHPSLLRAPCGPSVPPAVSAFMPPISLDHSLPEAGIRCQRIHVHSNMGSRTSQPVEVPPLECAAGPGADCSLIPLSSRGWRVLLITLSTLATVDNDTGVTYFHLGNHHSHSWCGQSVAVTKGPPLALLSQGCM